MLNLLDYPTLSEREYRRIQVIAAAAVETCDVEKLADVACALGEHGIGLDEIARAVCADGDGRTR